MPEFEYCRECNHLLPAGADVCPHCGERQEQQRKRRGHPGALFMVLLTVGVVVLVAAGVMVYVVAAAP